MALSEAFLELQPPTLRSSLGFFFRQSPLAIDGRKAAEFFYLESNLVRIGFGRKLRQR
jgi:hypothetical protein